MQLDALGQPVTALLYIAQVFDLPAILFEGRQAAVAVEAQATFAVGGGQAAYPPHQMRYGQLPADLFFQQRFRRGRFIAPLVGNFEAHLSRSAGQACCASTQWAGQANVVVVLALQPEQGAAAGIFRGANPDLAVDLPAIDAAELCLVLFPLRRVARAFNGFAGAEARATGEQGDEAENDNVAQKHKLIGSRIRSGA